MLEHFLEAPSPMGRSGFSAIVTVAIATLATMPSVAITNFINFETAPVHPIALGPDGRTLAVCNLSDNRVEFFDVSQGLPASSASVPVGLDPVTARFASSNELWVVNHISSTISIVDVAALRVVATIETPAGPSDLVFLDRDGDGYFDTSEAESGFDSADPKSHPGRIVGIAKRDSSIWLAWESAPGARYAVEWRSDPPLANLTSGWSTLAPFMASNVVTTYSDSPPANEPRRFYRVRME